MGTALRLGLHPPPASPPGVAQGLTVTGFRPPAVPRSGDAVGSPQRQPWSVGPLRLVVVTPTSVRQPPRLGHPATAATQGARGMACVPHRPRAPRSTPPSATEGHPAHATDHPAPGHGACARWGGRVGMRHGSPTGPGWSAGRLAASRVRTPSGPCPGQHSPPDRQGTAPRLPWRGQHQDDPR